MKNFEQIRAKNALAKAQNIGKGGGGGDNVAKKVPVMIIDNGILAAAAFALENNGNGYADVFDAVVAHLADKEIALLDRKMSLENFIDHLSGVSSDELRRITAEAMAYLNYLRRFA